MPRALRPMLDLVPEHLPAARPLPAPAVASGVAREMTVWWLREDRTIFDEGELHGDENPDSHPA